MTASVLLLPLALLVACNTATNGRSHEDHPAPQQARRPANLHTAHFAAGCFWCTEEIFEHVDGVAEVINGYAGGTEPNPTYEQVSSGRTGHAEAIEVYYDPEVVSFGTLVAVFFASQDPTTANRQGPDSGPQYRSIAFYDTPEQQQSIRHYIRQLELARLHDGPIVTEVMPLTTFWPAEPAHQNYAEKHPDSPYIKRVSVPRLERFKAAMPEVIKGNAP